MVNSNLESIACEFFSEFARYEYCLKVTGIRKENREAKACWKKYAVEVAQVFEEPQTQELRDAIFYFTEHPPKKQVVINSKLDWEDKLPDHKHKAELILLLVCRVRNNLFHGGKFNEDFFEPERSEALIKHALVILKACANSHQAVRQAYLGGI